MIKITFIILLVSYTYGIWSTADTKKYVSNSSHPCDSDIYCHGDLLRTIQMSRIFNDSKTFVDMKMKNLPAKINKDFEKNMKFWNQDPNKTQLNDFIRDNFDKEDTEFEKWTPPDYIENLTLFDSIKDTNLKNWANRINKIWLSLGRKIKDDVRENPELYSLIYIPNPVIIPGGRFREVYYWDSYWIIRGLLLCKMNTTARGMISNYISMIKTFGYVPNGGRIYYAKRSQPPMIIPMMKSYVDSTNDMQFMKENIHELEVELQYWITNHNVTVKKHGKNYTLAVYKDSSTGPRPESYWEDIIKGETLQTKSDKENFYSELKAAAESGWDFSSRWFILNGTNQGNILNVKTKSIVPVDLNSLVYWGAAILSEFYRDINISVKADEYSTIADQWKDAVTAVLWHEDIGSWLDFDLINYIRRNYFYPTNISPLWTGCFDKKNTDYFVSRVLGYLNRAKILNYVGGIPTTLMETEEQWDQPNAWPPLQYIMVMALDNTDNEDAKIMASKIANKWLCTNYVPYKKNNTMYEKYLVNEAGRPGVSSGEYPLQEGFGWTNGIILEFLLKYNSTVSIESWKRTAPDCYDKLTNLTTSKNCTK